VGDPAQPLINGAAGWRWLAAMLVVLGVAGVSACSARVDRADAVVAGDAADATGSDDGMAGDAADVADGPVAGSCAAILACTSGCMSQMCADACHAMGTPEAQMSFDAYLGCLQDDCAAPCSLGINSCDACAEDLCGAAGQRCQDS
jgi:hypothetical protein